MDKLINRLPGSRLLISSLPGLALRTLVESLGKPCLVNLISKDTLLVFSISISAIKNLWEVLIILLNCKSTRYLQIEL